jgi:hypothetical protein
MAIIGILSAVVLPPLISKIEDANSVGEDAKLEEIARALVAGIKASGTIPNPNRTPYNTGTGGGWGDIAYQYTTLTDDSVNPGTLHYVFPDETQSARRVYLNDQFMTYLVAATGGAASGVFQTPTTGWPVSAGGVTLANIPLLMYVVSGSKKDLFLNCGENQATAPPQPSPGYSASLISDLQNWVKTVQPTSSPNAGSIMVPSSIAQWGTASGGQYRRGEFLHVKVVDLRPLFCWVDLTDTAAPEIVLSFSVPSGGGGSGYPASSTAQVNYGDNKLNFVTDGGGNVVAGTKPTFSQCSEYNIRHVAVPGNSITGGAALFDAPASPNPPTYDLVSTAGPGTGTFVASQTVPIYVIKGRPINLFNGLGVLDKSLTIQSDVQLRYYNNSWTRVD